MERRWTGTWKERGGTAQTLTFVSLHSEAIARITFQQIFRNLGQPVPQEFTVTLASSASTAAPDQLAEPDPSRPQPVPTYDEIDAFTPTGEHPCVAVLTVLVSPEERSRFEQTLIPRGVRMAAGKSLLIEGIRTTTLDLFLPASSSKQLGLLVSEHQQAYTLILPDGYMIRGREVRQEGVTTEQGAHARFNLLSLPKTEGTEDG